MMEQYENVSMKSGLEGRNKHFQQSLERDCEQVSMKSGLEGRNNLRDLEPLGCVRQSQ